MNGTPSNSPGLPELHVQLRITNRLLAAQLKGKMQQGELISLLATTGASQKEIAEVLDTSPQVVANAIYLRKKKR